MWSDVFAPGAVAVLRTGLTPVEIAAPPLPDFIARVLQHRQGRRVWQVKLHQVHTWAQQTVACPDGLAPLAWEGQRVVARIDQLTAQMTAVAAEIDQLLERIDEARFLRSIPGLGWASVAGIIAHVGAITKYQHRRQHIKLPGTNPSRRNSGLTIGRFQAMTRQGRAGLRKIKLLSRDDLVPATQAPDSRALRPQQRETEDD